MRSPGRRSSPGASTFAATPTNPGDGGSIICCAIICCANPDRSYEPGVSERYELLAEQALRLAGRARRGGVGAPALSIAWLGRSAMANATGFLLFEYSIKVGNGWRCSSRSHLA